MSLTSPSWSTVSAPTAPLPGGRPETLCRPAFCRGRSFWPRKAPPFAQSRSLLERAHHDRCAAFDPPRPLYLLLACHAARTLPPAAQDLRRIIQAELADAMALPAAD